MKSNKEQLIENIQKAPAEHVKKHLIGLIQDLVEEDQITAGYDNGYIDNEDGIPLLDFYIDKFMFTNFTQKQDNDIKGFYKYKNSDVLYQITNNTGYELYIDGELAKYIFIAWNPTKTKNLYKKSNKEPEPGEIMKLELFEKVEIPSYEVNDNYLKIVSE